MPLIRALLAQQQPRFVRGGAVISLERVEAVLESAQYTSTGLARRRSTIGLLCRHSLAKSVSPSNVGSKRRLWFRSARSHVTSASRKSAPIPMECDPSTSARCARALALRIRSVPVYAFPMAETNRSPAPNARRSVRTSVSALVIDDDDDARDLLAVLLRKAGYTVRTARDGREALEVLRVVRPRVIFLDLIMPGMSGAEFRAAQRHNREWLEIPTVVMTGTNEEPVLDLAIEETLRKPVRANELLAIVQRHEHDR